ncbi:vancomycin permeability regulator SanA [Paenibacillus cellulosilyticus]|uniref:Vancomycin permeability regulator SanA n=1 Tax=Paenibacillus cellulosilyticus TaxID=375489 RepID=A0A2V2YS27_9BACL|nr:YdcF family protein [Paenibacillus cellulosilyticus]PWW00666.1 vancomycin permeability regulator SanA [Paenibacillus cellulosilyticus]
MNKAIHRPHKVSSRSRPRRKSKPLLTLLRIVVSIGVLGVIWCGYLLWLINSSTPPQSIPKSDAAIVLGAALWSDKPSPGLKERLDRAFLLYKEGKADKLILTGGYDHNGSKLTEAEGMRNYLVSLGVPKEKLLLEKKATSTYENMVFSKEIIDREKFQSILIVTHDYHTSRSKEIAKYVGIKNATMIPFHSNVLKPMYNQTREVLAYTKWKMDAVLMHFGWTVEDISIPYFNK